MGKIGKSLKYRDQIIKTKLIIYDESNLMKKLVYDRLAKDAGINIIDIFDDYNEMKNFILNSGIVLDGIILNQSFYENGDFIKYLLDLKNFTVNLIIISNLDDSEISFIERTVGAEKLIFIKYLNKSGLKDIFDIKEKLINVVYGIKNSRIKRAIFDVQKAIVIASSTGGPKVLEYIFGNLETKIDMPVFIVQHMPEGHTKHFVDRLSDICSYKVCEGKNGEIAMANVVYIAPSGYHMEIDYNKQINLNVNKPLNNVRPSADVLFCSASKIYKKGLLGIVLTGMGRDGSDGIRYIKINGGITIAQDEGSSTVFGMPKSAIETGMVDKVLSKDEILFEIVKHSGKL